jgi:hypothetical protein
MIIPGMPTALGGTAHPFHLFKETRNVEFYGKAFGI